MKTYYKTFLLFLLPFFLFGNENHSNKTLFLHLNKKHFHVQESIWFQGYIISTPNLIPDTTTANIYLELWDITQTKHVSLIIKPENSTFFGNLTLNNTLPDGNYILLAYTESMLNGGQENVFRKNIYISNPDFANLIDNNTRKFNRRFNQSFQDLHKETNIRIFPEGGHFISDLAVRTAVLITDGLGKGVVMTDVIIKDRQNKRIASFRTNNMGIGTFEFTPNADQIYLADIPSLGIRNFPLPEVKTSGITLRTEQEKDYIRIIFKSRGDLQQPITLSGFAHEKKIFELGNIKPVNGQIINLLKSDFNTGINRLLITNEDGITLAERSIFIQKNDQAFIDIKVSGVRQEETDGININLRIFDKMATPLKGILSASVYYDSSTQRDYADNLFSYLFLSRNINRDIPNPIQLFDSENPDMMDHFMLTLNETSLRQSEHSDDVHFTDQYGITLKGTVFDPSNNLGISNLDFDLLLPEGQQLTLATNERGAFESTNLRLTDSALIEFKTLTIAGNVVPASNLNSHTGSFHSIVNSQFFSANAFTKRQEIIKRGKNWKRQRNSDRKQHSVASVYGQPDQIIRPDPNVHYNNILELIRDRGIGLTVDPSGDVSIRGPVSIGYQYPPLYIVDGVESGRNAFMSVLVRDLDRVEIFKGASTAAFGARGASGALIAYSRRAELPQERPYNPNLFVVKGFHSPRPFHFDFGALNNALIEQQKIQLSWEPNLKTDEEGNASFTFPVVPGLTKYNVVIQGITEDGKIAFAEFQIGE
jgi:hypothetical protein